MDKYTRKGSTNIFKLFLDAYRRQDSAKGSIPLEATDWCQNNIADAAVAAFILDLVTLKFTHYQEGIAKLAEALFEAGQSVGSIVRINCSSYLPCQGYKREIHIVSGKLQYPTCPKTTRIWWVCIG